MQKASIFVTVGIVGIVFFLIMVNRTGTTKTGLLNPDNAPNKNLSLDSSPTSVILERQRQAEQQAKLRQQQQVQQQQLPPTQAIPPTSSPATVLNEQDVVQDVVIKTSKGDIAVTLYKQEAPDTVANFVKKAQEGFYKDLVFHRVEDWVIQGGDPKGDGTGGGNMRTELNKKPFVIGSVGVARGGNINISNDAQFFITKKEASWLNEQYTNFGMVASGMDVVEKIEIGDKIIEITLQ